MILTGWEISKKDDGTYHASERKLGRDGLNAPIDTLTGRVINGSLEEVQAQLKAWHMKPSQCVPLSDPATVIEFWY